MGARAGGDAILCLQEPSIACLICIACLIYIACLTSIACLACSVRLASHPGPLGPSILFSNDSTLPSQDDHGLTDPQTMRGANGTRLALADLAKLSLGATV